MPRIIDLQPLQFEIKPNGAGGFVILMALPNGKAVVELNHTFAGGLSFVRRASDILKENDSTKLVPARAADFQPGLNLTSNADKGLDLLFHGEGHPAHGLRASFDRKQSIDLVRVAASMLGIAQPDIVPS